MQGAPQHLLRRDSSQPLLPRSSMSPLTSLSTD